MKMQYKLLSNEVIQDEITKRYLTKSHGTSCFQYKLEGNDEKHNISVSTCDVQSADEDFGIIHSDATKITFIECETEKCLEVIISIYGTFISEWF